MSFWATHFNNTRRYCDASGRIPLHVKLRINSSKVRKKCGEDRLHSVVMGDPISVAVAFLYHAKICNWLTDWLRSLIDSCWQRPVMTAVPPFFTAIGWITNFRGNCPAMVWLWKPDPIKLRDMIWIYGTWNKWLKCCAAPHKATSGHPCPRPSLCNANSKASWDHLYVGLLLSQGSGLTHNFTKEHSHE